jgi:hypothetical protein
MNPKGASSWRSAAPSTKWQPPRTSSRKSCTHSKSANTLSSSTCARRATYSTTSTPPDSAVAESGQHVDERPALVPTAASRTTTHLPDFRTSIAEKYGCGRAWCACRLPGNGAQTEQRGLVLSPVGVMGAVFNLNHPAHTVDWEFIHLSVANVVVIVLMLTVFVLAILLPFPGAAGRDAARRGGDSP